MAAKKKPAPKKAVAKKVVKKPAAKTALKFGSPEWRKKYAKNKKK